jgi:hypothetical protein
MRKFVKYHSTYLERAQQTLIDAHHRTRVVELSAVVWRTEKCDELTLREELVAVFYDLVSTADEIHVVLLQETRHDVGTEGKANTSVVLAPPSDVLVGVGPQQIAEETAVGNLDSSVLVVD